MIPPAQDGLRDQLISAGVLTPAEVSAAVARAAEANVDLECILRREKKLTEQQLTALHALRLGVPSCNVADFIPTMKNAQLVPEDVARRHVMFPLFDLDGVITLVMENPHDLAGIDQVRRLTRKEVDVALAGRNEVLGLIERAYGASQYLRGLSGDESLKVAGEVDYANEAQPVIRLVNDLINEAVRQGASDIHIEPCERELRVRIRVDGVLREIAAPPAGLLKAIISRIKVMARLDISQTRTPQDGAIDYVHDGQEVVLRVSILPSIFGEVAVLRILRNGSSGITLLELGMPHRVLERFQRIVQAAHGMILVSGPTGSGKSTTLYAALKTIAAPQKNIIAIEDPVEYRTTLIRQVQVNREADLTFANGLRSILRQDPDVVMVGEIRDCETAEIAVQASLTGHMVLSTVHTNDSIGAIARLRDLGVPPYMISASLLAVLAQRLCRRICPDCTTPDAPQPALLEALGLAPDELDFEPKRGRGCRRCFGTGYLGRTGIYELFEVSEEFCEMIARGEPAETLIARARERGMQFLMDDGVEKIRQGVTTVEEVARLAGRN